MKEQKPSHMANVTRESIDAAKQAQARDRELVYQATGIRITEDGRVLQPERKSL